jgi:hypothetical protein
MLRALSKKRPLVAIEYARVSPVYRLFDTDRTILVNWIVTTGYLYCYVYVPINTRIDPSSSELIILKSNSPFAL